jgi:hypothetical protein
VIENYLILSRGRWPDPKSEENNVRNPNKSHRAPFEDPVIVASEICIRVRQCGMDGILVQLYAGMLGAPQTIEEISLRNHIDITTLNRKINKVAWYCTEKEYKKGLDYETWKKNKRYRRKNVRKGQALLTN